MARALAMSVIVQRAQRRCDRENDGSISTAEWKAMASEVYGELCAEINDTCCRYFETEATLAANGAASYDEPADILQLIGIDFIVDSAGTRRTLNPATIQERSKLAGRAGDAYFYQHIDDQIVLYPNPTSGTYKVLYVPQPADLEASLDADLIDLVCPAGERFMIWSLAGLAQHKGEVNQQRAQGEVERARQDLRYWAANRNLVEPPLRTNVVDVDLDTWDPDFWSNRP